MTRPVEYATWSFYDGKGRLRRSSYKMSEETARQQLPAGATKVPGSEEIRHLPTTTSEAQRSTTAPAGMMSVRGDARPTTDLIVCGARFYDNAPRVVDALKLINARRKIRKIIHCQTSPLDFLVIDWAAPHLTISLVGVPLEVKLHGHHARPRQLEEMFSHKPHGVIAFPGDAQSNEIIAMAMDLNVPVWQPYGP